MALSLVFAGIVLMIASFRNSQQDLYDLVAGDFTGPNNFIVWVFAIVLVGALGYIPKLRGFANALLAFVVLAIFLSKGKGFFDQLSSTVKSVTS
jgi:hypothetical protein